MVCISSIKFESAFMLFSGHKGSLLIFNFFIVC